jgi:hypothetical protein
MISEKTAPPVKDSEARMKWIAEQMRFRLKEALAQRGGSDAFLHWLRADFNRNA